MGILAYLVYRHFSVKYGFQIPLSVDLGGGLFFPHFGGIVVNSQASVGKNCNILHGVTIGNNKNPKHAGTPTIGDNVYIGPNAVIIGNVHIGNGSLIVGNSFVNCDVPRGAIAIGNPAQIICKQHASLNYINNCAEFE